MRKLIAFDFHGVLSMDNEKAVKFYIDIALARAGISLKIDLPTVILHYGVSFKRYFQIICPERKEDFYDFLVDIVAQYQALTFEPVRRFIKPQRFAKFTLETLKEFGHNLIVISNTPQPFIVKFTDAIKLTNSFSDIIGTKESVGIDCTQKLSSYKACMLSEVAKAANYDEIIMVGDAASDILAGKEAGAKTYLFCSPSHDEICDTSEKWNAIISQTKPDHVITDLRELIAEI